MKVCELIERLKKCNSEHLVVLSSDSSGNWYNKLREIEEAPYIPSEHQVVDNDFLAFQLKDKKIEDAVILYP